jgi:hypothetical protein
MNDEILVRVMHCGANRLKQPQPSRYIEAIRVAEGVDGDAIDVLHDNVSCSIRERPAIQQVRDVWMIQLRENLALDLKARVDRAAGRAAAHHFDGHLLFEFGIRTLGKENLSHAADTQGAQYAILSDAITYHYSKHAPRRG